ncbi:hypothetical protein KY289_016580 [Solanum tuberosum]|nr:hypothetical protein KY289_016580 [Solanum tuberosum]
MSAYQKLIIKRCPQLHLLQLEGKGKGGGGGRGQNVRGTDANARSYQGQPQQPDAGIDRILEFLESLDPPAPLAYVAPWEATTPPAARITPRDFIRLHPPTFTSKHMKVETMQFLEDIKEMFISLGCLDSPATELIRY